MAPTPKKKLTTPGSNKTLGKEPWLKKNQGGITTLPRKEQ